jgi:hypothetical protein
VPIADAMNLGGVSAAWLTDVGIDTLAKLKKVGSIGAFRRVAIHRAGEVSTNLLYALEGAIHGVRWDLIPAGERDALRREAEGEGEPAPARKAKRGTPAAARGTAPTRKRRGVVDAGDVRAIALGLPETVESQHMGHPDMRVRKKIFCSVSLDGATIALRSTGANLDVLVRSDPETFSSVWAGRYLKINLARVSRDQLRDLIEESWLLAAPKTLAKAFRQSR